MIINLLISHSGREGVMTRYGTSSELEEGRDGREPGLPGNVSVAAKAAREKLKDFFARRDGVH